MTEEEFERISADLDGAHELLVGRPVLVETDGSTALALLGILIQVAQDPDLHRLLLNPDDRLGKIVYSLAEQVSITPAIVRFLDAARKSSTRARPPPALAE